jgi:hypothetical protein
LGERGGRRRGRFGRRSLSKKISEDSKRTRSSERRGARRSFLFVNCWRFGSFGSRRERGLFFGGSGRRSDERIGRVRRKDEGRRRSEGRILRSGRY